MLLTDTSTPAWHDAHRELPFVFVGSAAAASGGLGMVTAPLAETGPARMLAVIGATVELVVEHQMEHSMGFTAGALHEGTPGRLMRASKILTAVGGASALLLGRRHRAFAVASGLALVAGSVCTRFGVFEAGQESARDPKYTVVPQRERLNARRAAEAAGPTPAPHRPASGRDLPPTSSRPPAPPRAPTQEHTDEHGQHHREPRGDAGNPTKGRVRLVVAALLLQLAIGAVYAWSVFAKALAGRGDWKLTKVAGQHPLRGHHRGDLLRHLPRRPDPGPPRPRVVALAGGVLYSIGVVLASFATGRRPVLAARPRLRRHRRLRPRPRLHRADRHAAEVVPGPRGLITGLAVGGFGFGAVLTAPVAQRLIADNPDQPTSAFLPLGIAYLVLCVIGACFFRNPPEGYTVPATRPGRRSRRRQRRGLHAGRGDADLAVVPLAASSPSPSWPGSP